MSIAEIAEDLFFIERGYLSGNHFVYRGERPVLIDTGYIGAYGETERHLKRLGVDPAEVELIVNTHIHCDHAGGNRFIQDRSGCRVALHPIGRHFIETRDDWAAWWRYFHQEADYFECHQSLEDGDRVLVGPHEFQVIHTPGHSADALVLYNQREKLLISSDTLWERDMAVILVRVEGSAAPYHFLRSLEKIEHLEVDRVYPGHGPAFTDFQGALGRAKARLAGYLADPAGLGEDLIKRIMVYTLLMRGTVNAATFFDDLMATNWYREAVDLYRLGDYRKKYEELLSVLKDRGVVQARDGFLRALVKA